MALSKIDTTNMIEDVPQSKLDNNINFRNIFINGGMDLAQRATSQATAGSAGGSYQTLDRWKFFNNSLGAFTWSQDTDVPTGQGFANSMKFDCTTADASPAAADYLLFRQDFEGQNVQYLKKGTSSAESLTLSFWVKSVKTGTYIAEIFDVDNSRSISKSYTIDSASTWEKKTLTFAGDTTGTLGNDNGGSLSVEFWLGAGTDYTSGTLATSWGSRVSANRAVGLVNLADSTDNEWYITGVQLEAGQTASEFEFLPVDVNLKRCQRYYYILNLNQNSYPFGIYGYVFNTNDFACGVTHPVPMRAAPSISTSGTTPVSRGGVNTGSNTSRTISSFAFLQTPAPYNHTSFQAQTGSGVLAAGTMAAVCNAGSNDTIAWSAEL